MKKKDETFIYGYLLRVNDINALEEALNDGRLYCCCRTPIKDVEKLRR
jgi:hypothetical protein